MGDEVRSIEEEDEDRKEAQARAERMAAGEGTVMDVLAEWPHMLAERQTHNLKKYGLYDPRSEITPEAEFRMMDLTSMSPEQDKQYYKADRAYRDRNLPTHNAKDPENSLLVFAATNPPEVLRRHIWRLQRGLDDPMFGPPREEPRRNTINRYVMQRTAHLCSNCARALEDTTERAGGERTTNPSKAFVGESGKPLFYSTEGGHYLFEWGEEHATYQKRGAAYSFPYGDPHVCERCGVDDVELWRDHFGDEAS